MAQSIHVSLEHTPLVGGATLTTLIGEQPGPTLAVLGGVHGDEDEGVLAVQRVLHEAGEVSLVGKLRAVAPANPSAWAAQSRTSPLDGGNLARCFPGDDHGSPTVALAAAITDEVIDGADLLIDLHSAGLRYRMPLLCGFVADGKTAKGSEQAAVAFGAPLIWAHPQSAPGRSLSAAADRGIPAIYVECSGGGSIRRHELDAYVAGVLSVMADLDMVPTSFRQTNGPDARWVYGAGDLDKGAEATDHGFFVSAIEAGAVIGEGTEIGRMYDYQGQLQDVVRAPRAGAVMFLRRQARTMAGDVLYTLAQLDEDGAVT